MHVPTPATDHADETSKPAAAGLPLLALDEIEFAESVRGTGGRTKPGAWDGEEEGGARGGRRDVGIGRGAFPSRLLLMLASADAAQPQGGSSIVDAAAD
jgi:hypothetical protein